MMKWHRWLWLFLFVLGQTALQGQVVNIEEQRITGTRDSVRWYGYLRGSAALAKVKQQSLILQGQTKVQYKTPKNLVLLLLNLNLLRAGNEDFTRNAFAHLRYNRKLNDVWVWEAYAQVQTSPIQLLDQRDLAGTGLRWRLLKSKDGRQRIYAGAAVLWEQNRFSGAEGFQTRYRSSNYLSTTFRPSKQVTLINTTYWQPTLGLIKNYRLSSEWLLKVDFTKKLSFTVEFDYGIDKNLPVGAPAETFAWRNGVMWQL